MGKSHFRGMIVFTLYFVIIFGTTLIVNIYTDSLLSWITEIMLCFIMNVTYYYVEQLACKDIKYEKGYLSNYTVAFFLTSVLFMGILYVLAALFGDSIVEGYRKLHPGVVLWADLEIVIYYVTFFIGLVITIVVGSFMNHYNSKKAVK